MSGVLWRSPAARGRQSPAREYRRRVCRARRRCGSRCRRRSDGRSSFSSRRRRERHAAASARRTASCATRRRPRSSKRSPGVALGPDELRGDRAGCGFGAANPPPGGRSRATGRRSTSAGRSTISGRWTARGASSAATRGPLDGRYDDFAAGVRDDSVRTTASSRSATRDRSDHPAVAGGHQRAARRRGLPGRHSGRTPIAADARRAAAAPGRSGD